MLLPVAMAAPAVAQTVVPGLAVEEWALVEDPVVLTAAPDGSLYVGRDLSGSTGGPDDPARIHRISPAGVVSEFGPFIDDPDAVLFDAAGVASPVPGSVLVGGRDQHINPLQGRVQAIAPDETAVTIIGPSTALINPTGMAFDSTGRLIVTTFDTGDVFAYIGGAETLLIDEVSGATDVVVDPSNDDLLVSWSDGSIRRYSSTGALLDGAYGTGRGLGFGPGNAVFGTDLYTVSNGDLLRIDPTGAATVIGSGFQTVFGLAFGADGNLYVTEFDNDRVLRISECPLTAEATGLMLAVVDGGANLQFTWIAAPGAIDHVVFEDLLPSGTFATETGQAPSGIPGLTVPMPAGNRFYLVGGRNGGVGPL